MYTVSSAILKVPFKNNLKFFSAVAVSKRLEHNPSEKDNVLISLFFQVSKSFYTKYFKVTELFKRLVTFKCTQNKNALRNKEEEQSGLSWGPFLFFKLGSRRKEEMLTIWKCSDNNNNNRRRSEFLVCNGAGKLASQLTENHPPLPKTSRGMQAKKFKRCLLATEREHRRRKTRLC